MKSQVEVKVMGENIFFSQKVCSVHQLRLSVKGSIEVVDEVAMKQVFSEYFCFPCQFSFHQMLHFHHQGLVQ
jgi:hypothetical protein